VATAVMLEMTREVYRPGFENSDNGRASD